MEKLFRPRHTDVVDYVKESVDRSLSKSPRVDRDVRVNVKAVTRIQNGRLNRRKGQSFLKQYSFDSMDEDF